MGELSKFIGDMGEESITRFLTRMGWGGVEPNIDLPCSYPDHHKCQSHGVDGLFRYKSPMISDVLDNVLISVKYSKKPYPSNLTSKFKEYYENLAKAIHCFRKSRKRSDYHLQAEANDGLDFGLLFWVNNVPNDIKRNLGVELETSVLSKDYLHDGIILVDNSQIDFLSSSEYFIRSKFLHSEVDFLYFKTGLNGNDTSPKNGKIMPLQYFSSSVIPYRVKDTGGKTTIALISKEPFALSSLLSFLGLAKNMGTNLQANTLIAFPDFVESNHKQIVQEVKQMFEDPSFTESVEVNNYFNPVRI